MADIWQSQWSELAVISIKIGQFLAQIIPLTLEMGLVYAEITVIFKLTVIRDQVPKTRDRFRN